MRIIGTDLVVGSQYTIIADMDIGFFGTSYINGIGASYAITNFNVAIMANTKCAENTGFSPMLKVPLLPLNSIKVFFKAELLCSTTRLFLPKNWTCTLCRLIFLNLWCKQRNVFLHLKLCFLNPQSMPWLDLQS